MTASGKLEQFDERPQLGSGADRPVLRSFVTEAAVPVLAILLLPGELGRLDQEIDIAFAE
jgi:hypothetical protein